MPKMRFVAQSTSVPKEPTDEDLQTWLEQHPQRFYRPASAEFTHILVNGDQPDPQAYAATLQPQVTLTQRLPWAVAFSFGLLHGCGFAGALQDIGLPPGQVPLALLCFNVGVELGQLGVIGGVALPFLWIRQWGMPLRLARTALIYTMGSVAVFWSVERLGSLLH